MKLKYILAGFARRAPFRQLKLACFRSKWRRENRHNFTTVTGEFPIEAVSVGKETYGNLDVRHFGNPREKLTIGCFCSIGPDCVFLLGGNHTYDTVSTYPFRTMFHLADYEAETKGEVVLEDDVWLSQGVTVLSGVRIGKGACIGAGSLVNGDIPPYAIAAGVPARVQGYRFDEKTIQKLMEADMSKLNRETILANLDSFYEPLTEANIDRFLTMMR